MTTFISFGKTTAPKTPTLTGTGRPGNTTNSSLTTEQRTELRKLQRENNALLLVAVVLGLAALILMGVLVT